MDRSSALKHAKRIVLKIGTSVLADANLNFDLGFFDQLSAKIMLLSERGFEIVVVTSGAIAAGRVALNRRDRPNTLAGKQAAAAVGQIYLMRYYRQALDRHGLQAAQVLLTHGDFQHRRRFLNARQTLLKLIQMNAVPLINENDTISVEEILVGDNDNLSAMVSVLIDADLLVMLCDVDGVYTADPFENTQAKRISLIDQIESVKAFAQDTQNPGSTGGMRTKLEAAKYASAYGIPTLITDGGSLDFLDKLLNGYDHGTLVLPQIKLKGRKHWIIHTLKAKGTVVIDAGAANALMVQGKSLLPAGVTDVKGNFGPGDPVDVVDPHGNAVARGLVYYGAVEVDRLKGQRSADIESILGYRVQDEIIHRDHLALL